MKLRTFFKKVRYESFGGITSSKESPFYKVINKDQMLKLGLIYSKLWGTSNRFLTSPAVVDFSFSKKRDSEYSRNNKETKSNAYYTLPYSSIKKQLYELHSMGVFHIAFKGDTFTKRDDFHKVINYCNNIGLTISLTTKNVDTKKESIKTLARLKQINFVINNLWQLDFTNSFFKKSDTTIKRLIKEKINIELTCLLSFKNFYFLKKLFSYASKNGIKTIKLIRYKPIGSNKFQYSYYALTQEMIKKIYPLIESLSNKYNIKVKTDCSFVPALLYHSPSIQKIKNIANTGCEAGNHIMSADCNGTYSACPCMDSNGDLKNIKKEWNSTEQVTLFRELDSKIGKPCNTCKYLNICKGGCRVAALNLSNNFYSPDPECPFVHAYNEKLKLPELLISSRFIKL